MPDATPDPKDWIDLQAVLTEELECIRTGTVSDDTASQSKKDSQKRHAEGIAPGAEFYRRLFDADLWGLCLSGGGIRSATFALGVIQQLAAVKLLARFNYLSTVSGGGYIGSWLSSWASREQGGIDSVVAKLNADAQGKKIEADPLWYLRSYTSYLNPKLGLLSADTWTLVATYLRNLLLNWLILIPLLWAVVLTPKFGLALANLPFGDTAFPWLRQDRHQLYAAWGAGIFAGLCLIAGMAYVFSVLVEKVSGAAAIHDGVKVKTQREFLLRCLLPILLAALALPLAWAWYPDPRPSGLTLLSMTVGIAVTLRVLAMLLAWVMRGERNGQQPAIGAPKALKWAGFAWIFIAALLTGVLGGVLVWALAASVFPGVGPEAAMPGRDAIDAAVYVCFAPPVLLLAMLSTEAIFVGLISRETDDEDREWWGRAGGWLLIASLFWTVLRVLAFFGPLLIHWLEAQAPVLVSTLGGISGVVTAILGFSIGSPANTTRRGPKTFGDILRGAVLTISAGVFISALFSGLALAGDWLLHWIATGSSATNIVCTDTDWAKWRANCAVPAAELERSVGLGWIVGAIAVLVGVALFIQVFVSVNKFSLHALYRARLIRAYLGASNAKRAPNWFTGFDPKDNLNMGEMKTGGSKRSMAGDNPAPRRPFHILNTALNLVHGDELAWQQRMAAPMSITPLHCGNRDLGYRRSLVYGHSTGISLGTALTISGAAASPNMGYHSSPIIGLVMTLFDVRLGAWLGNPGTPVGDRTAASEGPLFSALYLLFEALGMTDRQKRYVYLTDGGHFENLGLYELVQRRCRLIVVSDAGCDPGFEFEDLGNAIRKIRIDLGIEIEMDKIDMHPRAGADGNGTEPIEPGRYFTTGTIRYPEPKDPKRPAGEDNCLEGTLIYMKPGLYGSEPRDVLNYAATHPDFPHEPTSDQWFDESQYESYRRLGRYVAKKLFGGLTGDATIAQIAAAAAPAPEAQAAREEKAAIGAEMSLGILPAARADGAVPAPGVAAPKIIHRRPPRKSWFARRPYR